MNASLLLPVAIPAARRWVRSQRNRYRSCDNARELNKAEVAVLASFFPADVLTDVRIAAVDSLENPWFYRVVRRLGIEPPMDMAHAGGIALGDTVVVANYGTTPDDWYSLIFHEMVHVMQYAELGLDEFVRRYVRGYLTAGMDYFGIPFEQQAYTLQYRFESAPDVPFSVQEEVRKLTGVPIK
jgi:hypothetical protein